MKKYKITGVRTWVKISFVMIVTGMFAHHFDLSVIVSELLVLITVCWFKTTTKLADKIIEHIEN